MFFQTLVDATTKIGEMKHLNFGVKGVPEPNIVLHIDEAPINDDKLQLEKDGDNYKISFKQENLISGQYKVKASNIAGESESVCQLTIQGIVLYCIVLILISTI